ncbi:MAG: hypothetical protein WKF75_18050 [Singulisphaera sp.]
MNTRRFRPALDFLPSRITPSGFSTPIPVMALPAETFSIELVLQEAEPTTLCAKPVLDEDDPFI